MEEAPAEPTDGNYGGGFAGGVYYQGPISHSSNCDENGGGTNADPRLYAFEHIRLPSLSSYRSCLLFVSFGRP